ncbi:hypothetical protein KXD93_06155 [Mucilaginibacter sp. BJC16-A38]|uniref:glycan-binding surface protein n=1 Tax=Mucilaginibacter phenanthrenivorans TaxID=1234842 RepID=UPI00215862AC|nr:glycan-binding surface protein [Mucilaginibacter phenanthrenivorans]MCR8557213.1 hypothetical protein [Mucilaginibacter phenanthrenivorans]
MKKKSFIGLCLLLLLLAVVALFPACKKNNEAAPTISGVRSYAASPNDTVLHSVIANGQWVVITGQNLQNATSISFDGVAASFNVALFARNSAVVQIPAIVFSTVDTTKLYTIRYATTGGVTTFGFKLGPAAPTITSISNVFANPGDSVFLYGANLVLVQHLVYGGTTIPSYKSSLDGTALGFLMPNATPTSQVIVTAKAGTVLDTISATPIITSISNENPSPGDSVYIYGSYLRNIQAFTFAGVAINDFKSTFSLTSPASSVGFVVPSLSQAGPVSVTTKFGTGTTVYNVNDRLTGIISDGEWGAHTGWQYWGGASLSSGNADFPGNSTQYFVLSHTKLNPGEGVLWSNYAIRLQNEPWVPAANLNDPPRNWALKFEVSIPKAWNGGTIAIMTDFGSYIYRWEPWQISATKTAPYKTKGWITVTIPLSSFRASDPTLGDGEGTALTKISDLTGASGNNPQSFFEIHNYSSSATATDFYGAFDNIRVVKIK